MRLTGKTREELATALAGKSRGELLELIFSLVTFERLLSAREIAEASRMSRRDVLAAMKAGDFVDPIFGAGFFCRAANSFKVSASAANAWRRSFFVPADSIPPHKKRSIAGISARHTDLNGESRGQKRAMVRDLSPGFLAMSAHRDNGK
jgi:hypothetical protein